MGLPFKNLKRQFASGGGGGGDTKLFFIRYPGGVIVFLIMSWGNNDLINDCPRGDDCH